MEQRASGQVIFLNGASSAGKTTLGRALQDVLGEPYLLLGLDTCFHAVPERWASGGPYREHGFSYVELPDDEGRPVRGIAYGEQGWRMLYGFHRAVAALARAGVGVIVDEMLLGARVRDDWLAVLAPLNPLLVGVKCSLAELERRELQRGYRPGLARWSSRQVHRGMRYDVVVDTTTVAADEVAATVREQLEARASQQDSDA